MGFRWESVLSPDLVRFFRDIFLPLSLFLVLLGVGGWAIVKIRDRLNGSDDHTEDAHAMLLHVRELHRQGDLSAEEYRSIKSRLGEPVEDRTAPTSGSTLPADTTSDGHLAEDLPPQSETTDSDSSVEPPPPA